jgi:hypothetical protein
MRHAFFPLVLSLAAFVSCGPSALLAEPVNPAHAIADKFAHDGEPTASAPPAKAAVPAKPAVAQAARPGKPDDAYEAEMLAAAKNEAEARRAAETATVAAQPPPAATAVAQAATPQPAPAATAQTAAAPAATPTAPPSASPVTGPEHATILLVLDPDASAADHGASQPAPVLCIGAECYVSSGTDAPAKLRARADITLTKGIAGDCEGHTHCIFRDVTLKPSTDMQIIDATLGKTGSSAPIPVQADNSCAINEGDLDCETTVSGLGYRAWIIPEPVAQTAGPLKLEGAIATDLIEENTNKPGDK